MPKNQNNFVSCRYFAWRLFHRDGVYYADGRGGKHHLGKHSLGTRDREKALETLRQLDEAKAVELGLAEAAPTAASSPTTTIAEGWRLFFEHCDGNLVMGGASAATIKRYSAVRDKHLGFCRKHGLETWQDFDEQNLRRYGKWLAQSSADRTVYLELTLLKSVNGWLIEQKRLPSAAKLVLALKKPRGSDTYCYSSTEVTAMVEHCRANKTLGWLADVITGLGHTGVRISESAGLRWSDVHLDGGILRIADERSSHRKRQAGTARTTKGKRSRSIPIHSELRELLTRLPRHADGFVFHAARGGRIRSRNVLEQFIQHVIEPLKAKFTTPAGEIGFEHGRLHSFRHFFCSQCFLGGASEGEIKEWLGHAGSKMVEHYRHLRSEDAQRKMNQIRFLERADGRPEMNREPASVTASGNQEEICATNLETSEASGRSTAGINHC